MLSEINLPATKANFVSEISFGRQPFNLWRKTFEIILYPTLQRLIGRNSVVLVGLSVFGIRHIFVIFNLVSIFLVIKNYLPDQANLSKQ